MYTDIRLKSPPATPDFSGASRIGYGTVKINGIVFPISGELLCTKVFAKIPEGNEIDTLRNGVAAMSYTKF